MKRMFFLILILLMIAPSFALAKSKWEIRPKYFESESGIFKAGSYFNPYVIKDWTGKTKGTIRPKYLESKSGIFEAGSYYNPYVLELEDEDED